MKIFVTSDTHFGHDKLVELSGRPVDFSDKILRSLFITAGDLLIHCGDFCIGNDERHMENFRLNTQGFKKKILVRGNHDGKSDKWYLDAGFDFVCENFSAKYFGKRVLFSHIPVRPTDAVMNSFDMNIHGHLHGNGHRAAEFEGTEYNSEWHYDLAPELHDYKIINLESILK